MRDEIKIYIDPGSCTYFRIDPEKYKNKLLLEFLGLTYDINIVIDHRHSISDGVFPFGISMLTEASHNQQSKALAEVQLVASTVFQALGVNAQPGSPPDAAR